MKQSPFARRRKVASDAYTLSTAAWAGPPDDHDAHLRAARKHRAAARLFEKAGDTASTRRHTDRADEHDSHVTNRMAETSRRYSRWHAAGRPATW